MTSNSISTEAANLINYVFQGLCGAKPSWRAGFKTEQDVSIYKQALALAFVENCITDPSMVLKGIAEARRDTTSPFMPSTGLFLQWCKPEIVREYHISKIPRELSEEDKKRANNEFKKIMDLLP
tara:strand:- start:40368 stop:40739 length:372 start_codon:yes stop_codon:yes gene_type:complete